MAQAKAGGLNAAFVRVGRGGNTLYPNPLLPLDAWAKEAGSDELQRAIDAARKHGLAFHAWRVVYHLAPPPRYQERMANEDRLVRDPEGAQHNGQLGRPAKTRSWSIEWRSISSRAMMWMAITSITFATQRCPTRALTMAKCRVGSSGARLACA